MRLQNIVKFVHDTRIYKLSELLRANTIHKMSGKEKNNVILILIAQHASIFGIRAELF